MSKKIIALIYAISCCLSFKARAGAVVISPSGTTTVSATNTAASSSVSYSGGKPVVNSVASQNSGVFEIETSPNTPASQVNVYLENRNTVGSPVDIDADLSGKFNRAMPHAPSVSHDASSALVITSFLGNVNANVSGYIGQPGKDASAVCADKVKDEYYGSAIKTTFNSRRSSDPSLNVGKCDNQDVFSIADYLNPTCSNGTYDSSKNGLSSPSFPYKLAIKKRKCERVETKKVCQIKQKVFEPVLYYIIDGVTAYMEAGYISPTNIFKYSLRDLGTVTRAGITKISAQTVYGENILTYKTDDLYPGRLITKVINHRSASALVSELGAPDGYSKPNVITKNDHYCSTYGYESCLHYSDISYQTLDSVPPSSFMGVSGVSVNSNASTYLIGTISAYNSPTGRFYPINYVVSGFGSYTKAAERHDWAITGEVTVATDYISTTAGTCDNWLLNSSGRTNRTKEFAIDDGTIPVKTYSYVSEASSCPATSGSISYNDLGLTAEWSTNQSDYLLPANQVSGTCTYGVYCGADVSTSYTTSNQQGETLRPEPGEVGSFGGRFDAIVFHQEGTATANIMNGSSGANGVVDLNVERRAKYCALINNSTMATIINPVLNIEKVMYYPWDLRPVSYVESKTFPTRNTIDYFKIYTGVSEPFRDYLKRLNCPTCPR